MKRTGVTILIPALFILIPALLINTITAKADVTCKHITIQPNSVSESLLLLTHPEETLRKAIAASKRAKGDIYALPPFSLDFGHGAYSIIATQDKACVFSMRKYDEVQTQIDRETTLSAVYILIRKEKCSPNIRTSPVIVPPREASIKTSDKTLPLGSKFILPFIIIKRGKCRMLLSSVPHTVKFKNAIKFKNATEVLQKSLLEDMVDKLVEKVRQLLAENRTTRDILPLYGECNLGSGITVYLSARPLPLNGGKPQPFHVLICSLNRSM